MNINELEIFGSTLAAVEIFSDLRPDERDKIVPLCRGQRYEANDIIVSHDASTDDVFFIVSGIARVTIFPNSGKEITFRDLHAGQMFGELSAIDGKPRSAHVIANISSSVVFITPSDFWNLLETYPGIAQKTLKYLTRLVRLLTDRVVEFRTLGVRNRIHAELLRLGRESGKVGNFVTIVPAPTHAEIANRVSTHREAVTREMGALTRQGIIRKEGNAIIIQGLLSLQKMVDEVLNDEK